MIFPSSSNAKIFLVIRRNCFYIKVCVLRVCLILQKTVLLCNRQSQAVACAPGLLPPSCHHVPEILSHTLMTKSELKSQSHFEQTFYLDHYSWFLNLFIYFSLERIQRCLWWQHESTGWNVLGSHRRYWYSSKTGTVLDPAAVAPRFPLWKTHSLMH